MQTIRKLSCSFCSTFLGCSFGIDFVAIISGCSSDAPGMFWFLVRAHTSPRLPTVRCWFTMFSSYLQKIMILVCPAHQIYLKSVTSFAIHYHCSSRSSCCCCWHSSYPFSTPFSQSDFGSMNIIHNRTAKTGMYGPHRYGDYTIKLVKFLRQWKRDKSSPAPRLWCASCSSLNVPNSVRVMETQTAHLN